MKILLLAATALIATPVIAQDTMGTQMPPNTTTQTTPPTTANPSTTTSSDPSMMQQTPTTPQDTDPSMQQPMGAMPGRNTSATMSQPMTTGGDPAGGYQPMQPAMQGQMQPGAVVRYQPAPSPSEAYPAPPPMQSYPICKRGQYDNCRQRGG